MIIISYQQEVVADVTTKTPKEDGTPKLKGKKERKPKEEKKKKKSKKEAVPHSKGENSLMGLVDLEGLSQPSQDSKPVTSFKLLGEDEQISMVSRIP